MKSRQCFCSAGTLSPTFPFTSRTTLGNAIVSRGLPGKCKKFPGPALGNALDSQAPPWDSMAGYHSQGAPWEFICVSRARPGNLEKFPGRTLGKRRSPWKTVNCPGNPRRQIHREPFVSTWKQTLMQVSYFYALTGKPLLPPCASVRRRARPVAVAPGPWP